MNDFICQVLLSNTDSFFCLIHLPFAVVKYRVSNLSRSTRIIEGIAENTKADPTLALPSRGSCVKAVRVAPRLITGMAEAIKRVDQVHFRPALALERYFLIWKSCRDGLPLHAGIFRLGICWLHLVKIEVPTLGYVTDSLIQVSI